MRYPEFLSKGDLIGICAPSAGVGRKDRKEESFDASLKAIHKEGWRTRETASVRLNDMRGGDAPARGKELNELFRSPDVKMVMAASGGDFLDEMLPYTDWDTLSANPKWLMGYSDPTGLLYPYTTLYDVASLYGFNAGSFDMITYFRDERDETYYDPDSFEEPGGRTKRRKKQKPGGPGATSEKVVTVISIIVAAAIGLLILYLVIHTFDVFGPHRGGSMTEVSSGASSDPSAQNVQVPDLLGKTENEAQALRKLKNGSEDALAWFIDRYASYVHTVVGNLIGPSMSYADIEEVDADVVSDE